MKNINWCLAGIIPSYTLREAMNQTQKFIGVLAILPLAMVALSPNLVGYADADIASEYDALIAQIGEKTLELRMANVNGDSDKVAELQDELKDIRNQIAEWKNN